MKTSDSIERSSHWALIENSDFIGLATGEDMKVGHSIEQDTLMS